MGKIIVIGSQKGGVGKTTTVLNLGYSLSRLGHKVLLVDGDPQGGMALASNLKKRTTLGLVNLLRDNSTPEEVVVSTKDNTMGVVGAGVLEPEDALFFENEARKGNLGKIIKSISRGYDYIFVDTPAGIGSIVTALMAVCNSVLTPVNCRNIAVKTLPSFLKLTIKIRKKLNPGLRIEGVVFTMIDSRNPSELKFCEELRAKFPVPVVFKTVIPLDERFETASTKAAPIAMLPDGEDAARPYMDLAIELKIREFQDKTRGLSDEHADGLF